MTENPIKVDMTRNPFRGIYAEIAREEGVTRHAVALSVTRYRNPRRVKRVLELIAERRAMMEEQHA